MKNSFINVTLCMTLLITERSENALLHDIPEFFLVCDMLLS